MTAMGWSAPWWAWAALAAGLGLGELHVPGSYLVWVAIGAAVTAAIDAEWHMGLGAQIAVFVVAAAISCLEGWRVYGRLGLRPRRAAPLNERDLAVVGAHGVVSADFVDGRGKVRLGDSVWLAEGADLPEGAAVVVSAVNGTTLVVEAAEQRRRGAAP